MGLFRIFNACAALIVAMAACCCSYGNKNAVHALDSAEEAIWDRPDRALSVLESLDSTVLGSKSLRARFSLLYTMALDRNHIDTTDISVILPAINYYERHGSDDNRMMAYYYLGAIQHNVGDYRAAIKSYMRAKEYSRRSDNLMFRGLISSAISDIYALNHNLPEKVEYAKEALDCFRKAGDSCRMWVTTGSLASYYADCREWKKSDSLYTAFFSMSLCDTAVLVEQLFNAAKYYLLSPDQNPHKSVDLFRKAVAEYSGKPLLTDYYAYAYALDLLGYTKAADEILSIIDTAAGDSIPLMIWKYRLCKHRGTFEEALRMFERSVASQDSVIISTLNQSVVQAQSDYFEAKSELVEKSRELQILIKWVIVLLALICAFVALAVYMYNKRKWQRRMNEMSIINEEVSNRLFKEHEALSAKDLALQNLRRKYIMTYKRQYSQLNDLCMEYWETDGSGKRKERIYAKVNKIVSVIDGCNQKRLERMIDENLDGIMKKLRKDMPDASENDFRFIALNILGFDAKTIARVMDYTVQSVYTKRVRLRTKISGMHSADKAFYLDFID